MCKERFGVTPNFNHVLDYKIDYAWRWPCTWFVYLFWIGGWTGARSWSYVEIFSNASHGGSTSRTVRLSCWLCWKKKKVSKVSQQDWKSCCSGQPQNKWKKVAFARQQRSGLFPTSALLKQREPCFLSVQSSAYFFPWPACLLLKNLPPDGKIEK